MKDMKFPVDVIWLDKNYRVVDIVKDARPDSFPKVFEPSASAKYILEVNSGFAKRNGIEAGDDLSLLFNSL